jgi:two-component system NarL family response regulator
MVKILLSDHQQITCKGLSSIITSAKGDYDINCVLLDESLIDVIARLRPDLLIADPYCVTEGLDLISQIKTANPHLRFMVVSNHVQRADVLKILNLGIKCYLSKNALTQEIEEGVAAALGREKYFCAEVNQQLFLNNQPPVVRANIPSLSSREREIINLIGDGVSDKDIAERLFLSFHTIRTHRKNIAKKLGFSLKNAAELVLLLSYLNDFI